jgi:hypothetical protein
MVCRGRFTPPHASDARSSTDPRGVVDLQAIGELLSLDADNCVAMRR